MTRRRAVLAVLLLLLALPLAGLAALHLWLGGEGPRLRAAEAVRRATGRELSVGGPVGLAWSLVPTVSLRDVSLSNPPGFSRPAFAQAERVEARVALWPLLRGRVEVRDLRLLRPDVLLERDAAGRPNWLLAPPAAPPPSDPVAPAGPPARRLVVEVQGVSVRDGRFGWRAGGGVAEVLVPRLELEVGGALSGEAVVNGVPLTLAGTAGPLGAGAWPVDLRLAGTGLSATLAGTAGPGGALAAAVEVPDLGALSGLAGRPLPPLRDVRVAARLLPGGVSDLSVSAGASVLAPGLRLQRAGLVAAALDQPVQAEAALAFNGLPLAVQGRVGSLLALLAGGAVPVEAGLTAGDATLSVRGTMQGLTGRGLDLAVQAAVPDLGRLGQLAAVPLPALRDARLDVRVLDAPGGIALRGLRFASQGGDVAGDVALGLLRPSLRGSLVSQRLDLDAWAVAAPHPVPPAPPSAPVPSQVLLSTPVPDRVLPDTPLPFAALGRVDADLVLSAAEAVWRGATVHAVQGRVLLQDGRLRLDPFGMQAPGGLMQGQLAADSTVEPPTLAVLLRAPGLSAGPLLAALGAGEGGAGTLDLDVQLNAAGRSPRALAATVSGHLGIALVDAEVENRWLVALFAEALRAANLPVEGGGRSRVACLALRADAAAGQVAVRNLALDSTRLQLGGSGTVNLAAESLDLHLRPSLRLGSTPVGVPLRLGGTLRAPRAALDPGALLPGRVGVVIGGPAPADVCGPALAAARGAPPPSPPEPARAPRPADLLRSLVR